MEWKLVVDSGSSLLEYPNLPEEVGFANVPLTLQADEEVILDDGTRSVKDIVDQLSAAKATGSACPSPGEFAEAFKGADRIICITITGSLSGTHNAAELGAKMVREENPNAEIYVLDTKSAGPAQDFYLERALNGIEKNLTFDEVVADLEAYRADTLELCFLLRSVDNLVKNGRVSRLIGSLVNIMGLRLVGFASPEGTFEMAQRTRGDRRGLRGLFKHMKEADYKGGRARIYHVFNEKQAENVKELILSEYPDAEITIAPGSGLVGYYAEDGGLMVAYEKN